MIQTFTSHVPVFRYGMVACHLTQKFVSFYVQQLHDCRTEVSTPFYNIEIPGWHWELPLLCPSVAICAFPSSLSQVLHLNLPVRSRLLPLSALTCCSELIGCCLLLSFHLLALKKLQPFSRVPWQLLCLHQRLTQLPLFSRAFSGFPLYHMLPAWLSQSYGHAQAVWKFF